VLRERPKNFAEFLVGGSFVPGARRPSSIAALIWPNSDAAAPLAALAGGARASSKNGSAGLVGLACKVAHLFFRDVAL
jgi:hypothetical protein